MSAFSDSYPSVPFLHILFSAIFPYPGTGTRIHIFTFFDGRPEAMSASSRELLVLLTFY